MVDTCGREDIKPREEDDEGGDVMKTILLAIASVLLLGSTQEEPKTFPAGQEHVTDPKECTEVCVPEGYDGDLGTEYSTDAEGVACRSWQTNSCSKTAYDPREECTDASSCSTYCSKVCCVCLRECAKTHHRKKEEK